MINAAWECPNCGERNVSVVALNTEQIEYCDQGCGEGPFVVRFEVSAEAFKVEGVHYEAPPDVPF